MPREFRLLPSPFKLGISEIRRNTHLESGELAGESKRQRGLGLMVLPVYNHLHFLVISRLQHAPTLTQGLNRDVFHAPCVSSPLCWRSRRGGSGVDPTCCL